MLTLISILSQLHLDTVQYYASSENTSLMPLVYRLRSVQAANTNDGGAGAVS